jgi:hypothetical protein
MFDVGSRKIISWQISLEVPNSQRILDAFRLAVDAEGLPDRFYCDNGKDFKKFSGKTISKEERGFLDNRLRALDVTVVWAKPYNAQAKAIERLFGTFGSRVWRTFESWVGRTGERSEHANYLYQHPELLPTFTQFCVELATHIEIYNNTPHRGFGMNGRTPAEVFAKERIAFRKPHAAAFALVFYRCETRTLGRHGITVDHTLYRLIDEDGAVHHRYQGEQVKLLIDPADISRGVVTSLDERFLCEAVVREMATHTASDAITQSEIERVAKHNKTLKRRAMAGDSTAQRHINWLREPANRLQVLRAMADSRRGQREELVAATGTDTATTVVLPGFSSVARDLAAAQARNGGAQLSAEDRALAATVAPISDERLDQLLGEQRGYTPAPRRLRALEDDVDVSAELSRVARLNKEKAGLCLIDGCEEPRCRTLQDVNECAGHWAELHLEEVDDDATREAIRMALEKEAGRDSDPV